MSNRSPNPSDRLGQIALLVHLLGLAALTIGFYQLGLTVLRVFLFWVVVHLVTK